MRGSSVGLLEWLRPGEHERVERLLADAGRLGVTEIRTGFSWADFYTPEGEAWYDWLLPRMARQVDVLPCFHYTPPSFGIAPKSSSPPRDPKSYGDFIDVIITRYGRHFEWIELWNEPNNLSEWDWTLDPGWRIFSQMAGGAAHWARKRGKRTVLGGMGPIDPNWMRLMCECGVVQYMDAVGIHAFPATFDNGWNGWAATIGQVREVLDRYGSGAEIWITETGYSTWRHDERQQVVQFLETADAPADRVYWYSCHDLDPDVPTHDGLYSDVREYHFGLKRVDGTPKLLFRLWEEGGLEGVREAAKLLEPPHARTGAERPVLVTGGAGFVGASLARRILDDGRPVLLYDDLSRGGVESVRLLRDAYGDRVQLQVADVRDRHALRRAVDASASIFHCAAQTSVASSVRSPEHDFEVNARGTLSLLEAVRTHAEPPPLVFASTHEVYGALEGLELRRNGARYEPVDPAIRSAGIDESWPLDFRPSPHACSKGAADQYVLDYAATFGLPAVVLRLGCVYGPHQAGDEDEGWIARLLRAAIEGAPVTLHGDGLQTRDALYIDDLVDALLLAEARSRDLAGQAFNLGGGPASASSLLEMAERIGAMRGGPPRVSFAPARQGEPRYHVADARRFAAATGWRPRTGLDDGVAALHAWLVEWLGMERERDEKRRRRLRGREGRRVRGPEAAIPAAAAPGSPRSSAAGAEGADRDATAVGPVVAPRRTMRAAVLLGGEEYRIEEVAVPEPGAREVRIRLEGCGVAAADVPVWEGRPWFEYPLAHGAPGHEGWGRVDAVGEHVTEFEPGDRVAFRSTRALAEYDVAAVEAVVKLPSFAADGPFPLAPLGCAMNVFRRAEVQAGQSVAIVGIGFLGALLTALVSQRGGRVIAVSRRPYAWEVARGFGAAEVVPYEEAWRVADRVRGLTGGRGCDRVIEAVGLQEPLDLGAELAREGGRLVVAGYHQDGERQVRMQLWNWKGIDVINAHERDAAVCHEGMRAAVAGIASGRLDPGPLYTHALALDELPEAFRLIRERPYGFIKSWIRL